MKKVLLVAMLFSILGIGIVGCSKDEKKNTLDPNALPATWRVECTDTRPLGHICKVGETITFVLTVYDENDQEVIGYDYSSAVWILDPADAAILSDTTGRTTTLTATKAQNIYDFSFVWRFKDRSAKKYFPIQAN